MLFISYLHSGCHIPDAQKIFVERKEGRRGGKKIGKKEGKKDSRKKQYKQVPIILTGRSGRSLSEIIPNTENYVALILS